MSSTGKVEVNIPLYEGISNEQRILIANRLRMQFKYFRYILQFMCKLFITIKLKLKVTLNKVSQFIRNALATIRL